MTELRIVAGVSSLPILATSIWAGQILQSLVASKEPAVWANRGITALSSNAFRFAESEATRVPQVDTFTPGDTVSLERIEQVRSALGAVETYLRHAIRDNEADIESEGASVTGAAPGDTKDVTSMRAIGADLRSALDTAAAWMMTEDEFASNQEAIIRKLTEAADESCGRMRSRRAGPNSPSKDLRSQDSWDILRNVTLDVARHQGRDIELPESLVWSQLGDLFGPHLTSERVLNRVRAIEAQARESGRDLLTKITMFLGNITLDLVSGRIDGAITAADARSYLEQMSMLEHTQLTYIKAAAVARQAEIRTQMSVGDLLASSPAQEADRND